jgi:Zn-dependent protease
MDPTFQVLPPNSPPPPQPASRRPGNFLGWIGAGAILVAKYGFLLLKTGGSMFVMIWLYSMAFGWPFAAGLVLLIFVHEMGHVIAAWRLGLPVSAPLFIPFVGAMIVMKQNPRDAWTEALMAYGGPLAGCLGSWACWALGVADQSPLLLAIAATSFLLNLFNMIPFPPLDGGRICAAVSTWFWFVGLLLLAAAIFFFHSTSSIVIIVLILFLGIARLRSTFAQRNQAAVRLYHDLPLSSRLTMAAMYLGLIAALLLGYWNASTPLSYLQGE